MLAENLFRKLGIQEENLVYLKGLPFESFDLLKDSAPASVLFSTEMADHPFDHILFWPQEIETLKDHLTQMATIIRPDGAIWLIIPKKKFIVQRGLKFNWEAMQSEALKTDLVDNKVVSFSDTDYATRFVIRKEHRQKYKE